MTNLKPITSEEVLARQVKEASLGAQQVDDQAQPAAHVSVDLSKVPIDTSSQVVKVPSARDLSVDERDLDIDPTGFNYRLPIGAYLLAFVYLQVFIIALVAVLINILVTTQHDMASGFSMGEIVARNQTAGIIMVISLLIAIFIFSGRKTLKWVVIGVSVILALLIGYRLYGVFASIQNADSPSIGVAQYLSSPLLITSVLVYASGFVIAISTIIYLLSKKVTTAYE